VKILNPKHQTLTNIEIQKSKVKDCISMTNDKAQMSNEAQNLNDKKRYFQHLTCPPRLGRRGIWISIVIWILTFGFV